MYSYWNKLAEYLSRHRTSGGVLTGEVLLEQLCIAYAEEAGTDPPEVRELFGSLEESLASVPMELSEQLWVLTCRLCSLHQRNAFLDGVALGFQLHAALNRRMP